MEYSQIEEINYTTDKFLKKLLDLQDKIESQMNTLITKKDLKIFEVEKNINSLIEKVAKNQ